MSGPKLTIVSIAYNQEQYISQALESFIMQKTDFSFEVIISDDCSTDNTAQIIREYMEKYPKIIKPIFREKNLGVISNYIETLSTVKSEYVIYCEGDDYFTDPLKLQKQVDFLDANPDFSTCFHPVRVFFEDGSKPDEIFPSPRKRLEKTTLNFDDLLKGNFMQTNSVMYRWRFQDENIKDIFPKDILPCDYFLHLLHAQAGDIGFLEDVMAEYRRHPGGIWWETSNDVDKFYLKTGLQLLRFYVTVQKSLAGNNSEYNAIVLSQAKHILKIYLKYKSFPDISALLDLCPEVVNSI